MEQPGASASKTSPSRRDGLFVMETSFPNVRIDRSALMALKNGEPLAHDSEPHYVSSLSSGRDNLDFGRPQSSASTGTSLNSSTYYPDFGSDVAPAPPDFSRRPRVHTELSNNSVQTAHRVREHSSHIPHSPAPTTPDSRERSSMDSVSSAETMASSVHVLPALQTKTLADEDDRLEPLAEEDDPHNFDLVAAPPDQTTGMYALEKQAQQLLSSTHLEMIFSDSKQLLKFTSFLNSYRPQSIPILIYYLDALKAIRAISYANAISEALEPIQEHDFTEHPPRPTQNPALQEKAERAFEVLVREDLPAYIVHTWIQVVSVLVQRRVTGTLAPHLRETSEGLAEVFCLSDPSRHDNPIVFASEEFHRTTQYGINYAIGRNCRFLQGPQTNPNSVRRLADACRKAKEHSEVFVNYRRDGSPFMNLLMVAPLFDSKGTLRYFIGAQVDVSGLVKECTGLESFASMVARDADPYSSTEGDAKTQKNEFQQLSEMFNVGELETVRNHGGSMHREQVDESDCESITSHRPRLLLTDPSVDALFDKTPRASKPLESSVPAASLNGKLEGVYQHYLLVRPAPSLRILFTSPSLRVPGILQSPFLSRIGGSQRVKADLTQALTEGRGVTAKIRWLTKASANGEGEGRTRWIHATPLYGHTGTVGVWMILLIDDRESAGAGESGRRFKHAPPISSRIGGKEYDPRATAQRKEREHTRMGRLVPGAVDRGRPGTADSAGDWQGHGSGSFSQYRPMQQAKPSSINSREATPSELSFQLR